MKLRSKETYWLLKNGLINSYPKLQKQIICEILIIGGGITGALMAYQLSQEGYKTVLIDKRDIAMGSTSATTALLQYEIDEPLHSLIKKVGKDAAVNTYREGVSAIRKLGKIVKAIKANCDFKKRKSIYVAHTGKELVWLRKEFASRKKNGLKVSWLSVKKLKTEYGIAGKGAILSADAASVDAYNLTHALLSYSVANYGLRVYDHTYAEKVNYQGQKNHITTDDNMVITCRHVIYASGYETQEMLTKTVVNLHSTYAFISEPMVKVPKGLRNTICWNTQDPYLYVRSTSDNRILVGGADEPFKNAERRDQLILKKELFLLEGLKKLFPDLIVVPDFSWAGTFGITKDALPYIGSHPDYPNSYFVLGFGGNGITFSVMGMQIVSDALAGRANKFLTYFSLLR